MSDPRKKGWEKIKNACPCCGLNLYDMDSTQVCPWTISKNDFKCMVKQLKIKKKNWPDLMSGERYRTHIETKYVVQDWCESFGYHRCKDIGLFVDDVCCNAMAPRNGGCQCERVKRQKVADKHPAEPAQTAPKLFQNNEFDTIPALNIAR